MRQTTNSNEPSTSISLLQLACDGDPDGWRRLMQVYGPMVYGWARRCGCQSADAADIMQDTFASVSRAIRRFDYQRNGATFRGWLWTIVRNKIRDQERGVKEIALGGTDAQFNMQQLCGKDAKESPVWDEETPPSEYATDTKLARRRMLELLRESFDPRSWRMFWETAVVGREPVDVAQEMGVTRWAVYKARARVL